MPAQPRKSLWRCPKCGERFVTRNMWHSCGKHSLKALFAHSEPHVFRLFQKFAAMVRACGPVHMIPQKSRVVFQVRVRFAGAQPRKSHLLIGFALRRKRNHPRFLDVISYTKTFHGAHVRIDSEKDLNAQVQRWLREAYTVGQQKHLDAPEKTSGKCPPRR